MRSKKTAVSAAWSVMTESRWLHQSWIGMPLRAIAPTREIGLRAAYAVGYLRRRPAELDAGQPGQVRLARASSATARYRAAMLVTGSRAATPASRIPLRAASSSDLLARPCCRRFA